MLKRKSTDLKMLFRTQNTFSVVSDNIANKVYHKIKLKSLRSGCGLHWSLQEHCFLSHFRVKPGNFPPTFSPFFPPF